MRTSLVHQLVQGITGRPPCPPSVCMGLGIHLWSRKHFIHLLILFFFLIISLALLLAPIAVRHVSPPGSSPITDTNSLEGNLTCGTVEEKAVGTTAPRRGRTCLSNPGPAW